MNSTLMFIQADMHRAINDGRTSVDVNVLDLKELIAAVCAAEARETVEKCGHIFGWIRPESLKAVREGRNLYCSIRRKKNDEYCDPVYCDPFGNKPVDVVAEMQETATTE